MTKDHVWRVGDLCTANYENIGGGIVYRVIDVAGGEGGGRAGLKLQPVLGTFEDIKRRKKRELGSGWCKPLSLVDLGMQYMQLGRFIETEAQRMGMETGRPEAVTLTAEQYDKLLDNHSDAGLCADISARDEK